MYVLRAFLPSLPARCRYADLEVKLPPVHTLLLTTQQSNSHYCYDYRIDSLSCLMRTKINLLVPQGHLVRIQLSMPADQDMDQDGIRLLSGIVYVATQEIQWDQHMGGAPHPPRRRRQMTRAKTFLPARLMLCAPKLLPSSLRARRAEGSNAPAPCARHPARPARGRLVHLNSSSPSGLSCRTC